MQTKEQFIGHHFGIRCVKYIQFNMKNDNSMSKETSLK